MIYKCRIRRLILKNPKTGYCEIMTEAESIKGIKPYVEDRCATVKGYIPYIDTDLPLAFDGEWKDDGDGWYFDVHSTSFYIPKKVFIRDFLAGIPGVGKKSIEKICSSGFDLFNEIKEKDAVDKLVSIGVGKKPAELIRYKLMEIVRKPDIDSIISAYLGDYTVADDLYKEYGYDGIERLFNNPYLIGKFIGLDLEQCDIVAFNNGFARSYDKRIKAYLSRTIQRRIDSNGDTIIGVERLINEQLEEFSKLGDVFDYALIEEQLKDMPDIKFSNTGNNIILTDLLMTEQNLADEIIRLTSNKKTYSISDSVIDQVERQMGILFSSEQREALWLLSDSKPSIITGGPGTGKSAIIQGLIECFKTVCGGHARIKLAAPTNKAKNRMSIIMGRPADTLHTLLEIDYMSDNGKEIGFTRGRNNPINADLIIIDEASMINDEMACSLTEAIADECKVIFIGDINQIPPIGYGAFFNDIILFSDKTNMIRTIRLTQTYRTSCLSGIITNAEKILNGDKDLINTPDFELRVVYSSYLTQTVANEAIKCQYNNEDHQVISPMYSYSGGINDINRYLQSALNSNPPVIIKGKTFKLYDKVVFTATSHKNGYSNGDVGRIVRLDSYSIDVDIDGNIVYLRSADIKNLELGYAISVHKSQGSEWDTVIVSLKKGQVATRALLYTAVTRARKKVVLICTEETLEYVVNNTAGMERITLLKYELLRKSGKLK